MAKIIRKGETPEWGVQYKIQGIIIDSFNQNVEIKDYEQTDNNGAVCGYLVYDQTANFDFTATLLHGGDSVPECLIGGIGNSIPNSLFCLDPRFINCSINTPTEMILKSISKSATAGGATTISASGTAYEFPSKIGV